MASEKVVKEFWKAALQGRIFHGRQCNVTATNREYCSRLQQSHSYCHSALNDTFHGIHCFSMGRTTPKIAPSSSRRGSHFNIRIIWFLETTAVSPQIASQTVQPILHSIPVWPKYRQAHRPLRRPLATCEICNNTEQATLCTVCMQCSQKWLKTIKIICCKIYIYVWPISVDYCNSVLAALL